MLPCLHCRMLRQVQTAHKESKLTGAFQFCQVITVFWQPHPQSLCHTRLYLSRVSKASEEWQGTRYHSYITNCKGRPNSAVSIDLDRKVLCCLFSTRKTSRTKLLIGQYVRDGFGVQRQVNGPPNWGTGCLNKVRGYQVCLISKCLKDYSRCQMKLVSLAKV